MTDSAAYPVNKLMQELLADPSNLAAFHGDRAALYDRYGLTADQRSALDAGDPDSLASIRVHPVLQMHHFIATNPMAPDFVSVKAYKPLVVRHG